MNKMSNNKLKTRIALAPMAGITDSAFRLMNVLGGADLTYSEMAHVNAISFGSAKTFKMLSASPFEFPYVIQLFGNNPDNFAKATEIIAKNGVPITKYNIFSKHQKLFLEDMASQLKEKNGEWKTDNGKFESFINFWERFWKFQKDLEKKNPKNIKPSGLDVNFGCPAKKVFGHGSGARLFSDVPKMRKILEAVLSNTALPVSIKMRTSVKGVSSIQVLESLKDLSLSRIMIHGRSYEQGFTGEIDLKILKETVKKFPQFEIWANGGIINCKTANKVIDKTKCNNLGIARGTWGNPLLGEKIKNNEKEISNSKMGITICSILSYIHAILIYQSKGDKGMFEIRKHLTWYFKDFPGAKSWRKELVRVEKIEEVENVLSKILSSKKVI